MTAILPKEPNCGDACRSFNLLLRATGPGAVTVRVAATVADLATNYLDYSEGEAVSVSLIHFRASGATTAVAVFVSAAVVLTFLFAFAVSLVAISVPRRMEFPGREGAGAAGNLLGLVYHLQVTDPKTLNPRAPKDGVPGARGGGGGGQPPGARLPPPGHRP